MDESRRMSIESTEVSESQLFLSAGIHLDRFGLACQRPWNVEGSDSLLSSSFVGNKLLKVAACASRKE